jgi:cytochrome oxidase assembly protein ShyY1
MQRAQQKETIEAQVKARESIPPIDISPSIDIKQMEYTRVTLKGEFVKDWPLYLDNRPMHGIAGIYVMMPFKLQKNSQYVLIARGWTPRDSRDRTAIKKIETPTGVIQIEGIVKSNSGHVLQLGESEALLPGVLTQNLEIDAFIQASKLPAYPFIVEQTSNTKDGLLRDWPRPSLGSERHRGYAFQWLALAATALLFFLFSGLRRQNG